MNFFKTIQGTKESKLRPRCLKCFRTLSVPARFRIYEYIKKQDERVNVASIVKYIRLRQPTVTFHLNELAKARLITKRKAGRDVFCEIKEFCGGCFISS